MLQDVNWLGLWTLYNKEVKRFIKVYNQTLIAPMITSLLFLAVFSLALGDRVKMIGNIPFVQFMIPGLIMMTIVQNAFANTSSAFIMGKVLGTMVDYLIPPISPGEMVFAMVAGGITRGICTGFMVTLAVSFFAPMQIHNIWLVFYYVFFASAMMALVGMIAGVFAESFDQMSAITSYVITPLTFLSGTFYSVKRLPEFWQQINQFNPFFYMIDGFRYSMTGQADASIEVGMISLLVINIILYTVIHILISKGYRIKT